MVYLSSGMMVRYWIYDREVVGSVRGRVAVKWLLLGMCMQVRPVTLRLHWLSVNLSAVAIKLQHFVYYN